MAKKKKNNDVQMVCIEDLMKRDYLDYAMSVIRSRSIPDIRDGLKPVQRRILWTMRNTTEYTKSARHVGDCLGKYHPHGECLKGDTILYSLDNTFRTIKDLYESGVEELDVLSYDESTGEYVPAKAHSFRIGQYTDKIYKIVMRDGSYVECTGNHPFYDYIDKCWVKAEDIKAGALLLNTEVNSKGNSIESISLDNKVEYIDIINVTREPMYDFTVDTYENALIVTGYNKLNRKVLVAHNSSCYTSMVKMAQPWRMYIPYVDGHGNFGSIDGDNQAAMRYCCTGDTIISTIDYGYIPIGKLAEGMMPNSDRVINIQVKSAFGTINYADRIFHSGKHEIYELVLENGYRLRGTPNHPVMTIQCGGRFEWIVLENLRPGMEVVLESKYTIDIPSSFVKSITKLNVMEDVYSIRVCSDCHSFITNGIVSHNTEARISRDAVDLFLTHNQMGVEFQPNYDEKETEPVYLTSPVPMLLVNGSSGSAVGYSTNIPSHNPKEVIKAYIAYIEGKLTNSNIRKYIKGPDHAIGCKIIDFGGIDRAYETGSGSYYCLMDYVVEQGSYGREVIRFTNVLPNVDKVNIIEAIASNVRNGGELSGLVSDLADESNMEDISIVVTLKKGVEVKTAIDALINNKIIYARYSITNICIVGDRPVKFGIIDFFNYFHDYQKEISKRHLENENKMYEKKYHILSGIAYAVKNYDVVIDIIKKAKNRKDAIEKLSRKFKKLDEEQIKAILDIRLSSLVNRGSDILTEQKELKSKIDINNKSIKSLDLYIIEKLNILMSNLKGYTRRCEIIKKKKEDK